MNKKTELVQLLKSRENLYRFLSRLYLLEVDEALLNGMKGMEFPSGCGEPELEEGYRMVEEYIKSAGGDWEEELAVDYAKVFLAAGVAQGLAAFPYESIYASRQRLMMQEAGSDVAALYRAKGLKPRDDMFKVPEDHIGLELDFMAMLCEEACEAVTLPDEERLAALIDEQRDFLKLHLTNWCGGFCSDLLKYAQTGFYKGLSKITSGFLKLEGELLTMEDELWAIA